MGVGPRHYAAGAVARLPSDSAQKLRVPIGEVAQAMAVREVTEIGLFLRACSSHCTAACRAPGWSRAPPGSDRPSTPRPPQAGDVDADERRRQEPDRREHAVAAADAVGHHERSVAVAPDDLAQPSRALVRRDDDVGAGALPPPRSTSCRRKTRNCAIVSGVAPDFEMTLNRHSAGSNESRNSPIRSGSMLSSTKRRGSPPGGPSCGTGCSARSAARCCPSADPPMPSTTMFRSAPRTDAA